MATPAARWRKRIVKILANTDYQQYGRILGGDKAFMERLSDELDSDQIKRIGDWNKQYAQWLQTRQ